LHYCNAASRRQIWGQDDLIGRGQASRFSIVNGATIAVLLFSANTALTIHGPRAFFPRPRGVPLVRATFFMTGNLL
jgi:hypothetical protein